MSVRGASIVLLASLSFVRVPADCTIALPCSAGQRGSERAEHSPVAVPPVRGQEVLECPEEAASRRFLG